MQRVGGHAPRRMKRKTVGIVAGCTALLAAIAIIGTTRTPSRLQALKFVTLRIEEAQAQQIENTTAQRVKDAAPMPGAEAALRHQIEAFKQGQPDLNAMTDDLATVTRPQIPNITRQFERSGALRSISFRGVGFSGFDIYEAKFEHGLLICRILMSPDNKISGLLFEWGP